VLALREHYQAEVTLQNLHVTVTPVVYASADNFVLPNRTNPSLPPLIMVKHLSMQAGLLELLRSPVHISQLKLDGLEIKVGPKRPASGAAGATKPKRHTHLADFVIDKLEADGTKLYILRKDPGREPLLFDLRK